MIEYANKESKRTGLVCRLKYEHGEVSDRVVSVGDTMFQVEPFEEA